MKIKKNGKKAANREVGTLEANLDIFSTKFIDIGRAKLAFEVKKVLLKNTSRHLKLTMIQNIADKAITIALL